MLTLASSHAAASGRTSVVRLRSCEILGKSNARRQLMRLNSTAFADGSAIPRRFTCDDADLSPPLNWSDAPTGTRKALPFSVMIPTRPAGTWHHWAAYDIPSTLTMLAEGTASDAEQVGFKQPINDFQRPGYGGPWPQRVHDL